MNKLLVMVAFAAGAVAVRHLACKPQPDVAVDQKAKDGEIVEKLTAQKTKTRKVFGFTWHLRPGYESFPAETLKSMWGELSEDGRVRAVAVLQARLSHRGRSYGGLQVLMALVAAVEAAIFVFTVDKGLLTMDSVVMGWGAIVAVAALICLCIGVLPLMSEVMPTNLEDEGVDAIRKSTFYNFGYFMELRGRSTHQRHVLWRSRVWFFISVTFTIVSLLLVIVGVGQYMFMA